MERNCVQERCTAWRGRGMEGEREAGSTTSWGSALMEELLETNVIADQSMAILKEVDLATSSMDPALMSDLRHDRALRPSVCSARGTTSNADVMLEAKRILRKEDKEKKILNMQNRIVDEEVDKFQNHIRSLRKMNQRLERIAFPTVKKRLNRVSQEHKLSPYCWSKEDGLDKTSDELVLPLEQDKSKRKTQHMNPPERRVELQHSEFFKRKSNLSVSGSKMNDHEILQHKPKALFQSSTECQNTVFEKIHQRYIESERSRVLKDGMSLIRHSSPIDDSKAVEQSILSSSQILSVSKDENMVHLGEWVEEVTDSRLQVIEKSEVCLSEWSLPSKTTKDIPSAKKGDNTARVTSPPTVLPPAVAIRKGDQTKLESLSKMYAKWMTKVCVSSDTKFDDSGCFRSKVDNKEESSSTRTHCTPISREEKIMQVLQALQKHKQRKQSADVETTRSSRFSKSVNDIREEKTERENHKFRRAISGSYEHRLKAHKDLITHQKAKLEEQKKEIENLRLSQLRMENEKSQIQTQKTLNEVMTTCSEKVKAQAKSLKSSLSLVDLSPENDFVLRMEQRALEQKQRKLLAEERRKIKEEERKKQRKELEEKTRLEEEELARKKHEEAREMRRKERELREEARKERENFIGLEKKADQFCQIRRLRTGLLGFKKLLLLRRKQTESALKLYDELLVRNAFRIWKSEVDWILQAKVECANYFYSSNLLHRCFNALKLEALERERRMQVAIDMYDFRLQEKFFRLWISFFREKQDIEAEKMAKAECHHTKTLLQKYLILWQKYPKIAQLEREKERRKMIWRDKVQQVLPDFRPMLSFD